jgi:hypothetical protein
MSASAVSHPLLLDNSLESEPSATGADAPGTGRGGLSSLQVAALALTVAGLAALAIGWFGISDKVEVWEQIPYLISGGLLGAVLIGFGIAAFVAHEHHEDRRASAALESRIQQMEADLTALFQRRLDELEMAMAAEIDQLSSERGRTRS